MFLYNFFLHLSIVGLRLASYFNPKARKLFIGGQSGLEKIKMNFPVTSPVVWMHCASLGEFEQGRPVLETLRKQYPDYIFLLTFFSPSGYENVRPYSAGADYVHYLPWDTASNTSTFVQLVRPKLALFIKYEFWPNYLASLHRHGVTLLSISSSFRKGQLFFKSYGLPFRQLLYRFSHFFVQNEYSKQLLTQIGITSVTVCGDTRFDRVRQIIQKQEPISEHHKLQTTSPLMIIGSCWPADIKILLSFINSRHNIKFIIAPHDMDPSFLTYLEKSITRQTARYTSHQWDLNRDEVLLIDQIGLLSRLYQYGQYAFVGGGYGRGLHNILEASIFGIPVLFGNQNYHKHPEAVELIRRKCAFPVSNTTELNKIFDLLQAPKKMKHVRESALTYMRENEGATAQIVSACQHYLNL